MKWLGIAVVFAIAVVANGPVRADGDDMKWIAKCMQDNAGANVAPEVVTKYCTCMNNKMDSNETKSISNWEKSHPAEMKACENEAGWK
ncbi:MAG: hypothetical protein HQL37_15270 [Alphaproteobacteria bacterium]|nr:hypothetical protein [Alphaproteobacteria bacterium]